jgi:mono/diheme cytochrome c family protein
MKSNHRTTLLIAATSLAFPCLSLADEPGSFDHVARIFQQRCLVCHNDDDKKGGLSLQSNESLARGGESGDSLLVPHQPTASPLLSVITPKAGQAEMPKDADPLSNFEIESIRLWIDRGAPWPAERRIELPIVKDTNWWSLRPIAVSPIPFIDPEQSHLLENPVDAFIAVARNAKGLVPNPPADRRTIMRRLSFDLVGLPPDSADVDRYIADDRPDAYERLVDQFLASPRYGERWARHWLDVVHYGETHGYDKDQPRPNAWPYRDYVIRSLNEDKPYSKFIQEQLAGDILFPGDPDGIIAMGFLAAGPWDLIGHAEVPESKIDGQIARHLDRDDMVATTINTFCSLTVQCAQCHHHKFDPISQEDYYRLHAVFAALDRTNRPYDADPKIARKRSRLQQESQAIDQSLAKTDQLIKDQAGPECAAIDQEIRNQGQSRSFPEAFGYHSQIEAASDKQKWVQIDLGQVSNITKIKLIACHDDFAGIGDGFGFPPRFRIDASTDPTFQKDVVNLVDQTTTDFPSPGCNPIWFEIPRASARYLRMTATRLAPRQNDFIFALAEWEIYSDQGAIKPSATSVTSLDSIDAPPRWRKENLVDGLFPPPAIDPATLAELKKKRESLLASRVDPKLQAQRQQLLQTQKRIFTEKQFLPAPAMVYSAGIHQGDGAFAGTGKNGGAPRPIHLLARGDVRKPGPLMDPGAIAAVDPEPPEFQLSTNHPEGARRAALAAWIIRPEHPLTWRTWVNRIWLYHFGHGIVDTPNDFGRMGELPTHLELLDWLADQARQTGAGWKSFHRMLVTSGSYRLSSQTNAASLAIDADNRFLWRAQRRKLEAEELRDAILATANELDFAMGGPSFQDFVIERPEHSPHYQYHLADLTNHSLHRRSVYRFLVRSQQQPWMTTMDCADPSMLVDKRNQTITPLQALALWNNDLVFVMARRWADHLTRSPKTGTGSEPIHGSTGENQSRELPAPDSQQSETTFGDSDADRIDVAFRTALARFPTDKERELLIDLTKSQGWPSVCRLIFNLNEFVFLD